MLFLIPILLVMLAAICNAVMDRIDDENIHESIWKGSNWEWWYKRESWDNAKRIFGWKYDGWHVFKSAMIIFLALAISIAAHSPLPWEFDSKLLTITVQLVFYGMIWNGTFNVFYNHVFKRKAK